MTESSLEGIAIIGMAGRFPGAANIPEFWKNLVNGVESITTFTEAELAASGMDVTELRKSPGYVASRGVLKDAEYFDANFFGMNPKEAEVTDPQQRLFLEASWEALEDAGYDAGRFTEVIGVYAGMGNSSYLWNNVQPRPDLVDSVGEMVAMMGNEKDFLASRVAFKLNLKGPAISVNTACSTSLVAVCQACHSLLNYQCDLALAGGISITFPQKRIFHFQEGGIVSPDGHCRAFDAQAQGTVSSDGLGIVVLKRLAEALQDGDQIYAVIRGVGLNNDGSSKGSFSAPSVDGQADAITQAQTFAGFDPATISYVEAHGTGTPLGDPIEITGLTQAFRTGTDQKQFCAIGSVKTNIGHLDTAAGVAGLIKTALALKNKQIPPSLHYARANPRIDFENSPFYVNSTLTEWKAGATPRRAGVSSFGLGGTNAHVVLEEAPVTEPSSPSRECQLLVLSAKTDSALNAATSSLAACLEANPLLNVANAAFTLQTGRAVLNHRRALVCRNGADAAAALKLLDSKRVFTQHSEVKDAPVVFMFPGQGAQYVNMGSELYRTEPVFRDEVDACSKVLQPLIGLDLRQVLFPQPEQVQSAEELLIQTRITQPALFVIEYALAKLWMSWGIKPQAMIGHSVGEYVAGCIAGVFTLQEALVLVASRAHLVQAQPGGSMLAVRLPEKDVLPMLGSELSIAAINSPSLCVVSGPYSAIEQFEAALKEKGIAGKRLNTSHAFHSSMMDPVIGPFTELLKKVLLKEPAIPYVSNATAKWITTAQAVDPHYWAAHVRQAVRFADGVAELLRNPQAILLEVGPGTTLTNLARQHPAKSSEQSVVASLTGTKGQEIPSMLNALGRLWLAGASVDWNGFYQQEKRHRVTLPTYPFERKRFYAEPARRVRTQIALEITSNADETEIRAAESPADITAATLTRKDRIIGQLLSQLQELSGANLTGLAPSTSFAELGYDSLFLAQLSQNLQKKYGVKVTFRQLSEQFSTLDTLAAYLDSQMPADASPTLQPVAARTSFDQKAISQDRSWQTLLKAKQAQLVALTKEVEMLQRMGSVQPASPTSTSEESKAQGDLRTTFTEPGIATPVTLPLTAGQLELWLGTQWGEDASRAMNHSFSIHLRGSTNLKALRETIQEMVDRHDALRMTFQPDGSAQRTQPSLLLEVPLSDFSALAETERNHELQATEKEQSDRSFDLLNGPLLRVQIIKLSEDHHVLLLASHHLIMDGWSISVVFHELKTIYSAKIQDVSAKLEPAMQFRNYVQWEKSRDNSSATANSEAYWLSRFASPPAAIELPTTRPRPPVKTYKAAHQSVKFDPALYQTLKQACVREGCTLFAYLFASINVWLHRLSGQTDLVVGVPAAGQIAVGEVHPGNKFLVGHCVNLLPIRSQCAGEMTFKDYLREVKRLVLDAHEHQQFTFANLVSKLNLPRDTSRMPLVSVTFNLNRAAAGFHMEGVESQIISLPKGFNIFDLTVDVIDSDKDITIDCRFNTDLFDAQTLGTWLNHWKTLLTATMADAAKPVSSIPILNASDCKQILQDWNDTRQDYPRNQCVHQLVEAAAAETPNAAAVVFDGKCLTYQELNRRANRLAHYLKRNGVGPDVLVGLCVERSLEMVIGLLGILKAGGAYLPLDPEYPMERVAFILQDAKAPVLLTQQSLLRKLPVIAPSTDGTSQVQNRAVFCLDPDLSAIPERNEENPVCATTQENLAYVLYTSGSTGQPKGVQIPHRALVNFLTSTQQEPGMKASDVLLAVTTLSFDIAGLELWLPLTVGAKVVIARSAAALDGKQLIRLLAQCHATVMQATPVTWRMLLEAGWAGNPKLNILCGGEVWSEDLVKQLLPKCASLWNMYGPTETTIWSAVDRIQSPETPVIGRPMANTQFYVLGPEMQPVAVGVPGELHIGGEGLARGYHKREQLTAEKFIKDPFNAEPNARLYKTGDLVRYRRDGKIEFLSRIDNQVKIRGYRIELGEIETILRQHPYVRDCVLAARNGPAGEKRLIGYVVLRPSPVSITSELRSFLKERLPDYMVPSVFVTLEALPLTPNGKVDRKALPEPGAKSETDNFVAPETSTQKALAEIWCEILKLKRIGIHDNFFELGGDSLIATQLMARLAELLEIEITMRDIFEVPTIAAMSDWLEKITVEMA
ncbi:hybrid non-ribosomal peptide synthetase/type I polyketide synthase [Pedosphaera parvula]|uniref:Phenolphthiocerol/phthiocerol polyketide synthase subunit E n=1 Tax=Pedosphaera parvula (strain Ellin514) TaxID=320771 RepID=B9XJE4_PEDPL|nr:hybrid non-ribosomal peptide synthetase/type I polyketide synthase [Pedosphaera parvula]EEF60005.1 amino acid adenylation domain protein [Pedosphaera parvula Ellin514]